MSKNETNLMWKDWKEHRRKKKASNIKQSLTQLEQAEIKFKILNKDNYHTLVEDVIDYWPSTGLWRKRQTGENGRGIRKLKRFLRK